MTRIDGNQEMKPFLRFLPKILCAYTKRHYLCTRKDKIKNNKVKKGYVKGELFDKTVKSIT